MDTSEARTPGSRLDLCEGVDPMGRGRAKAKQTKVARDLKYRTIDTDFSELQRELHGDGDPGADGSTDGDADSDLEDTGYGYADEESAAR